MKRYVKCLVVKQLRNNKAFFRQEAKRVLYTLRESDVHEGAEKISRLLFQDVRVREAEHILVYLSYGRELSLDVFIERALRLGKKIYTPHILSEYGKMEARRLDSLQDVGYDRFGIRQSKNQEEKIAPQDLDIVLVPGALFARDGSRLGKGGGYYDRFLTSVDIDKRMGVSWSCQMSFISLPMEKHDMYMGSVITEKWAYTV